MTCRDLMTANPAYCVPQDTVVTAAMIMKNHDVGSVPVVSDRDSLSVIGMITDRDIALRVVADQLDYYNTHVDDVMSKDVATCRADDNYNDVIDAMKERQIRRVPVIDDQKRLCGIIALADFSRQAPARDELGVVVEEISKPDYTPAAGNTPASSRYTTASLLVAGGLGLGAGLIYILDPLWARRATNAVRETVSHVSGGDQ